MPRLEEIVSKKEEVLEKVHELGFDNISIVRSEERKEDPYVFIIDTSMRGGKKLNNAVENLEKFLQNIFDDFGILVEVRWILNRFLKFNELSELSKYGLKFNINIDKLTLDKPLEAQFEEHVMHIEEPKKVSSIIDNKESINEPDKDLSQIVSNNQSKDKSSPASETSKENSSSEEYMSPLSLSSNPPSNNSPEKMSLPAATKTAEQSIAKESQSEVQKEAPKTPSPKQGMPPEGKKRSTPDGGFSNNEPSLINDSPEKTGSEKKIKTDNSEGTKNSSDKLCEQLGTKKESTKHSEGTKLSNSDSTTDNTSQGVTSNSKTATSGINQHSLSKESITTTKKTEEKLTSSNDNIKSTEEKKSISEDILSRILEGIKDLPKEIQEERLKSIPLNQLKEYLSKHGLSVEKLIEKTTEGFQKSVEEKFIEEHQESTDKLGNDKASVEHSYIKELEQGIEHNNPKSISEIILEHMPGIGLCLFSFVSLNNNVDKDSTHTSSIPQLGCAAKLVYNVFDASHHSELVNDNQETDIDNLVAF